MGCSNATESHPGTNCDQQPTGGGSHTVRAMKTPSSKLHCYNCIVNMASPANMRASLPCLACRAIVPNRSQLNYLENSTLETRFERDDLYPTYPGVASSAQAGCSLCVLMWRRLTSLPPEAIESIEKGNGRLVWISSEQRTGQLDVAWDRKVKIRATFDFLPYATVSPSGSICYERASTPQDGYQHGGAVTSMSIRCRPVTERLRLVDGTPWNGETFEFPVFDSIGMPMDYSNELYYLRLHQSRYTCSST
jgi:hypothetical protein